MKIISQANNANNSRATIEFEENGVLTIAEEIAKKHGCGFSHNVTTKGVNYAGGKIQFSPSFGTISFNKGKHADAMTEFITGLPSICFMKKKKVKN